MKQFAEEDYGEEVQEMGKKSKKKKSGGLFSGLFGGNKKAN